jgi:hypothetical protein
VRPGIDVVLNWKNQSIDLLNEGGFRITEPGPLHAPIHGFKIRRDENLTLWLETEAALDAKSTARPHPSGTVRINMEQVELGHASGAKATLSGVQTLSVVQHEDALREVARVHVLTAALLDLGTAAYTIEWLENMPAKYLWPDTIKTDKEETTTLGISFAGEGITIRESDSRGSSSQAAVRLIVAGRTFYVCAPVPADFRTAPISGFIVYVGTPDDLTRKKIRTALSLALGVYLVETGHTLYDNEWQIVTATSRSAYSLGRRAFDLPTMPLTPLSDRNFQFDIGRDKLTRMVDRLFAAYDALDLGNLSWAYWHACTATVHIAPAHFGAVIEALQRAYVKMHPAKIETTILPRPKWDEVMESIAAAIAAASIGDDIKGLLAAKIRSGINFVPQRERLRAISQAINIDIGPDEDAAWKRRDLAAHGLPIPEGKELEAIRDMKLLMKLFHRMLLSITGAADAYIDYASPGLPPRRLKEPVPPMPAGMGHTEARTT